MRSTGEILAEKSAEMDRLIEERTGLDAQRFLRSVLLAQGQFAAFLKAKPNERAELLEKITGTEIYTELSKLAFETYKARRTSR
jgi:exonuclease SbcC